MEDISWKTEKRFVEDLIPLRNNPRKMSKHDADHLMSSLQKFNYVELIAIQPDNRIIAGHMRVTALKKLNRGKETIEVRVPNRPLTEDEMREYVIRSNRNTGKWDWDILASDWDPNHLFEWGFLEDEIVDNILDANVSEEKGEEDGEKCSMCGQKVKNKKDGD